MERLKRWSIRSPDTLPKLSFILLEHPFSAKSFSKLIKSGNKEKVKEENKL